MEILKPSEIGARIATMIIESKSRFIAISPFVKISDWKKITTALEKARERDISIELYFREIKEKEYNFIRSIGIKAFKIPGLHTKLYMNDSSVLTGSMNLYEYSDLHSRELGIYYVDQDSYNKFYTYYSKNIETVVLGGEDTDPVQDLDLLSNFLTIEFNEIKINREDKYLYCKNLFTSLDLMINNSDITIKLFDRDPDNELIESYSLALSKVKEVKIIPELMSENSRHMYWKFSISGKSYDEIGRILVSIWNALENFPPNRNSSFK